jgi:hypothetical protein
LALRAFVLSFWKLQNRLQRLFRVLWLYVLIICCLKYKSGGYDLMSPELPDEISLPPGRRHAALTPEDMRRAEEIFRALYYEVRIEFEPEAGRNTRFVVSTDPTTGEKTGLIIIGPDLFPGPNVANPNSVLDAMAAAAHEITHLKRWEEGRALPKGHLDEAMTSLQAACSFRSALSSNQIEQLVTDALQRLLLLSSEIEDAKAHLEVKSEVMEEVKDAD